MSVSYKPLKEEKRGHQNGTKVENFEYGVIGQPSVSIPKTLTQEFRFHSLLSAKEDQQQHWRAYYIETNKPVSIFIEPINELSQNAVHQTKTLRHPSIIQFIDSELTSTHSFLITEPVVGLPTILPTLSADIIFGFYQISGAISFLWNEGQRLSHNNISLSSIFINPYSFGAWKVGNLHFVDRDIWSELSKSKSAEDLLSSPQEGEARSVEALSALKSAIKYQQEVTKEAHYSPDLVALGLSLSSDKRLASIFKAIIPQLSSSPPTLDFSDLLSCDLFTSDSVTKIASFLSTIRTQEDDVKRSFFERLPSLISELDDEEVFISIILPKLVSVSVLSEATAQNFLPTLFSPQRQQPFAELETKIIRRVTSISVLSAHFSKLPSSCYEGLLPEASWRKNVLPFIYGCFSSRDCNVRFALLHALPFFVGSFGHQVLIDQVLPSLLVSLNDSDSDLVIATIISLYDSFRILLTKKAVQAYQANADAGAELVELFQEFNTVVSKKLTALITGDPVARIRSHALLTCVLFLSLHCAIEKDGQDIFGMELSDELEGISPFVSPGLHRLLSKLLLCLSDREVDIRKFCVTAVGYLCVSEHGHLSPSVVVNHVLPSLTPRLLDEDASIRSEARSVLVSIIQWLGSCTYERSSSDENNDSSHNNSSSRRNSEASDQSVRAINASSRPLSWIKSLVSSSSSTGGGMDDWSSTPPNTPPTSSTSSLVSTLSSAFSRHPPPPPAPPSMPHQANHQEHQLSASSSPFQRKYSLNRSSSFSGYLPSHTANQFKSSLLTSSTVNYKVLVDLLRRSTGVSESEIEEKEKAKEKEDEKAKAKEDEKEKAKEDEKEKEKEDEKEKEEKPLELDEDEEWDDDDGFNEPEPEVEKELEPEPEVEKELEPEVKVEAEPKLEESHLSNQSSIEDMFAELEPTIKKTKLMPKKEATTATLLSSLDDDDDDTNQNNSNDVFQTSWGADGDDDLSLN